MVKSPSRLSRRQLIGSVMLGSAGVAPWSPGIAARRQAGAARWVVGDPLRLAGSVSGPASLDPALSRDLATNFLVRQVFRGLTRLDATLKPVPELAESVDVSEDGLTYNFTIRDSARFHDGRGITPEDISFSLSRALDPAVAGGSADGLAGVTYLRDIQGADDVLAGSRKLLTGIDVRGDYQVTLALERHSPTFLMKLASAPASVVDARQVRMDPAWPASPNGSGPFILTSWEPGSSLELRAAATWWRGQPEVESVHVRLGSSASQPLNLFQAGEIDLLEDMPAELAELVRDPASGVSYGALVETPLFATSYIAFGNKVPPLDDVHLRKALQHVFPGRLVADVSFNGAVTPASGLLPPGMLGQRWQTQIDDAGVEAARHELGLSRYGAAEQVPPVAIYAADIAPVESLRDVAGRDLGIVVEAIQVQWSDFLKGLAERRFPAYSLYWGADYPDPESMIDMLFGSGSADNYTGYSNPDLDALLDEARQRGGNDRIDVFARANQLLVDDAALIPLYHPVGYTLIREGVGGVEVTPMGILAIESINALP